MIDKCPSHWFLNHPTVCYRKSAVLEVGNYNSNLIRMTEDFELGLRLLKRYGYVHNMSEVLLKCGCGAVRGVASNVTANSGTRIVCCCDDCQAFARYLDCENTVLDEYGGTDIFQMPISRAGVVVNCKQLRVSKNNHSFLLTNLILLESMAMSEND